MYSIKSILQQAQWYYNLTPLIVSMFILFIKLSHDLFSIIAQHRDWNEETTFHLVAELFAHLYALHILISMEGMKAIFYGKWKIKKPLDLIFCSYYANCNTKIKHEYFVSTSWKLCSKWEGTLHMEGHSYADVHAFILTYMFNCIFYVYNTFWLYCILSLLLELHNYLVQHLKKIYSASIIIVW